MNPKIAFPLVTLALSLTCAVPVFAQAADPTPAAQAPIPGERQAQKMVPARAALKETLDAKKVQPGFQFHAVLARKIQLVNGPLLPEGTILTGQVVEDDMKVDGISKLALRFTSATLKDGLIIPIRAMIVGVEQPVPLDASTSVTNEGDQVPNKWTSQTLQIDQIDVLSGIDLHSAVASGNSGIFVSTKAKPKDVQLKSGSEFALAIATRPTVTAGL